jgi:hypothetical protein
MAYKWTVMVYMAGDNNLDSNGVSDLKEMKKVGSTDEVAIIAQFDRAGRQRHTKRYHIRKYSASPTIKGDEVADLGETNTGSAREFTQFIKWGMRDFTADHYLVIIWAHGTGAYDEDFYYEDERSLRRNLKRHGLFLSAMESFKERSTIHLVEIDVGDAEEKVYTLIAPDDESKDFLDNVELKKALKAVGQPIDILGMDACLMSMAEVFYQVRESVRITVASEAEEELEGWAYEGFLRRLVQDPEMNPKQLAETIVEEFGILYGEYETAGSTLSACDLKEPALLVEAVDGLAGSLLANLTTEDTKDEVMLARYRVWENDLIESVDLYDLCYLLHKKSQQAELKSACKKVMDVVKDPDFVLSETRIGDDVKYCHGVGIYFPKREVSPLYKRLDFVKPDVTRWGAFIKKYVEVAQR